MSSSSEEKGFRKHTKKERREEKHRYRARKKQSKKQLKLLAKGTDVGGQVEVSREDRRDAEIVQSSQAIPGRVGFSRGLKMIALAKENGRVEDREQSRVKDDKSIPRIHREDLTYQNEDSVGSGSFGNCYRGFYRANIPVVIKKFKKSTKEKVLNEAKAIQEIQGLEHHPCLPFLIGVSLKLKPYMLVTQFHGGNDRAYTILTAIESNLIPAKLQWINVLIKLAKALGFTHNRGWIHNDLKENNVVLHLSKGVEWTPIIIDFGKSTKIVQAKPGIKRKDAKHYYWIAPEVLTCEAPPSTSSDIFSLGNIIKFVTKKVLKGHFPGIKDLYLSCLSVESSLRPKSAQAVAASLERCKSPH